MIYDLTALLEILSFSTLVVLFIKLLIDSKRKQQ